MRFSTLAPEVRSENTYGLNMQFFFLSPFRACSRLIVDAASPGTISIDINKKYPLEPSVAFQYISGSARHV